MELPPPVSGDAFYLILLLVTLYRDETGEESYLIPVGGSVPLGNWGYFECFEEIRKQVSVCD